MDIDIKNRLLALVNDETAFMAECARLLKIDEWRMARHNIAGYDVTTFKRFFDLLKSIEVNPDELPFPHPKWRSNGAMTPKEYCSGLLRFLAGKSIEKWKWADSRYMWQNGRSSNPSDEEILEMGLEEFFAYMGLAETVHGQMSEIHNHLTRRPSWEELGETLIRSEFRDGRSWCITRDNDHPFLRAHIYTIMF